LYTVAKFTDVDDVTLIDKERAVAAISSHRTNNSQTLHFGDIETNYTLEKAEEVKDGAELLAGYLGGGADPDRELHSKRSKIVLGVGDEEVAASEERYRDEGFGDLFPKLREIGREEIAELEPKGVEGRDPDTELKTLQTPDGYVVDYGAVAASFVDAAREEEGVSVHLGTEVTNVDDRGDGFTVETDDGDFDAEAVVVTAGSHSLQFAKEMGYGGVRPQIVDTENKELDMGEAKIVEDGILFNITPSPGASTALKNAMTDVETVLDVFDEEHEFDETAFRDATIENFPRADEEGDTEESDAEESDAGGDEDDRAPAETDD
jgi:L-2-hydroxyglutarate oxidase LhgO